MTKRQYYRRHRMFLILALLSLYLSLKPFLISAIVEKSVAFETKGHGMNQISHMRHVENSPKRRTMKRRMIMNVEEINDYPGSGANNRHTPKCSDC
ncbi:unnamed protein product [Cochlearia groenlandica]